MSKHNIDLTPGNVKEATAGLKSADLWQVPYEDLYILPGFNVRDDTQELRDHIQGIASMMVANGYDRSKPMAGYVATIDGVSRIVVTDGHNRHKAIPIARELGADITHVPVVTTVRGTSMEDLTVALATSNSGKQLTAYELGTVCKRLQGFGWDDTKIASKLGVTEAYVGNLLFLQSCPKAVRDLVRAGSVAAATAIAAVRKHGDKAAAILQGLLDKNTATGKTKVTPKDMPIDFTQATRKAAPKLYEGLMNVKEDAGYSKLHPHTREFIEKLIADLPPEPKKVEA